MAIRIPPPPEPRASIDAWAQWYRAIWERVRGSIQLVADVAATVGSGTTYIGVSLLTAPRTLTLPPTAYMQDGDEIIVQDESGNAGTHTITIAGSGTDTINGAASVTITSNYGRKRIIKRGSGKYYSA